MEVDRLEVKIEADAKKAVPELDRLISKLNQVSSAMVSMSGVKTTDFSRLANNLNKIGAVDQTRIYQVSNVLRNFANTMNGIGSVSDNAVKLGELANGISRLGGASAMKATANLPLLSVALRDFMTTLSTAPAVSENLIRMTNAMGTLASQGSKYGSTINGIAKASNTLTKSTNTATNATKKFTNLQRSARSSSLSLTSQLSKLVFAFYSVRRAVQFMMGSIEKSMDFSETVNLFQTSFKKIGMETASEMGMAWGSESADTFAKGFITEAQNFNTMLTNALSLDPNVMMNYQAVFAQMTNSMGLVAKSSMNISESFSMLGVDIASLWNIDTDVAMKKLQSGLAGQIRPLRQLGIDISQTSLEMTALNYGIEDSVISMSQAAKIQLRWLSIMDQAEVAFGDMAKTIESPKNQMRILSQQWTNLSRSIGNVFLPVITAVLPYINATVIALRNMIDTLAKAMGYEIPDYTDSNIYTDATGDIEGMTDGLDDATTANEKLKKSLYSGDELNILTDNSKSGNVDSGSGYENLDDEIQKKTESYMAKFNEELGKMSNKSKDMAVNIQEFFKTIGEKIEPTTTAFKKLWDEGLSKVAGFVGTDTINWYEKFLIPVGTWVLGEGLPALLETANGLLNSIDWDKLNGALGNLYDALAPVAIGIGSGIVKFITDLGKVLEPVLGATADLLADSIKSLADSIGNVDSQTWEDAGYAIGVIGTTIGGMKIVAGLPAFLLLVGHGLSTIGIALSNLAYLNPVALPALFDTLGLDDWLDALYLKLPEWVQGLWEGFWQTIYDGVVQVFNFDQTMLIWGQVVKAFKDAFDGGPWYEIGWNIIKGIFLGIAGILSFPIEVVVDFFDTLIRNIKNVFGIASPATEMEPYGEYIMLGLLKGIKDGWNNAFEGFRTWLALIPGKIYSSVGTLVTIFAFKGTQIILGIKQGWNDSWKTFKEWLALIPATIGSAIGSLFSVGKDLIDSFISGFQSVVMPWIDAPKINYYGNTTTGGTGHSSYGGQFALGGMPDYGDMFIANEKGPELVGRIGNRTAVANTDQITTAITNAIIQGNVLSQPNTKQSQASGDIVLVVGEEEIARVVNRGQLSINQRYSLTLRTV